MSNPDERRGDLRAQLARHGSARGGSRSSAHASGRDAVAAAMDELVDYSERRVRAGIAALPDGRYEATELLETVDDELELRVAVDGRGRRARARLRRHCAAARRQPQLPACRDRLGLPLRRPLPDRPRRARHRRRARAGDRPRAGRLPCERASRRPPSPPATSRRRTGSSTCSSAPSVEAVPVPAQGQGTMNNVVVRERALHLLRDDRRRPGRLPGLGRAVGRARGDVEHALDPDRGARARLPAAGRTARAAARLGRCAACIAVATASSASCACSSRAVFAPHPAAGGSRPRAPPAASRGDARPEPPERRRVARRS